ncbi:hypothetical protein M0813_08474 [Anaeramoeba flamelloides]|uniref:Uncharacterized protein n=1 Tax=Anaeramoeba flamelloides TaxID=1746091 RepID=A0ABQ8XCI0_9EUKA|nr:hypothetical protein M0813_08474 [Anaeramoeba flamelloides]
MTRGNTRELARKRNEKKKKKKHKQIQKIGNVSSTKKNERPRNYETKTKGLRRKKTKRGNQKKKEKKKEIKFFDQLNCRFHLFEKFNGAVQRNKTKKKKKQKLKRGLVEISNKTSYFSTQKFFF